MLGQHVERDRVRVDLGLGLVAGQQPGRLLAQLAHRRLAGPADRLVARHDDALQADGIGEGLQGHDQRRGHAVGVGDDAGVPLEVALVDLGDHQRDGVVHPVGAGVVDHHGAGLDGRRPELQGAGAAGRKKGDVDPLEALLREAAHRALLAEVVDPPPLAALGRQRAELGDGEAPLLEHAQHGAPDRAGGPDDGDVKHRRGSRRPGRTPGPGRGRPSRPRRGRSRP